jgi:chloramphenicol 3-O-phosphotransferase
LVVTGLVLIGAPGAGKSSVLEALTSRLEGRGISYGAIESEELARGWPLLPPESWLSQLAAVIRLQRECGRRLFLIAATTETADELRGVLDALDADQLLVVCLEASPEIVASRIAEREPDRWPGKPGLIAHARELARGIPKIQPVDVRIDTENREPDDVAAQIENALIGLTQA